MTWVNVEWIFSIQKCHILDIMHLNRGVSHIKHEDFVRIKVIQKFLIPLRYMETSRIQKYIIITMVIIHLDNLVGIGQEMKYIQMFFMVLILMIILEI